MKNKAIKWLTAQITDEMSKGEYDIVQYLKGLVRADKGVSAKDEVNEQYIADLFAKFYGGYKRKGSREQAFKTFRKKLIKLKSETEILAKVRKMAKLYSACAEQWEENETEMRYIPLCSSWLNANVPD